MATFKVGQRVRIVGVPKTVKKLANLGATGREGVVVVVGPHDSIAPTMDYGVQIDGWPCSGDWGDFWGVRAGDLAPLTGPEETVRHDELELAS